MRKQQWLTFGATLSVMLACARWATAEDITKTCETAGWDMNREITAFRGTVPSMTAGTTPKDVRTLQVGVLSELSLKPQGDVQFVMPPERPAKTPMPLAGLAQFKVPATGNYRITVDLPLWLDAVSASSIIPSGTFNGWHECSLFRKTVQYALQAGQVVVLQFSGAATDLVKVLIEPAPAAT